MTARALKTEEYRSTQEPYYAAQGDEIALFEAAFANRLPVHAGKLIAAGIDPRIACRSAVAEALTDDAEMLAAVNELGASLF